MRIQVYIYVCVCVCVCVRACVSENRSTKMVKSYDATIELFLVPASVTKDVVCAILSVGWCI